MSSARRVVEPVSRRRQIAAGERDLGLSDDAARVRRRFVAAKSSSGATE
jgi:hypothetical protein